MYKKDLFHILPCLFLFFFPVLLFCAGAPEETIVSNEDLAGVTIEGVEDDTEKASDSFFLEPIPDPPKIPKLPDTINNSNDMRRITEAYTKLIDIQAPILNSLVFNGLEANRELLDKLHEVVDWWRGYFSTLVLNEDSADFNVSIINTFFSDLLALDEQLKGYLARLNRIIEIENKL